MPQQSHWHHYIARMQQRPFSEGGSKEHIWVFDKQDGSITRRRIADAGALMDYYTVELADGATHDRLERTFAEAENRSAPILQRLRQAALGPVTLSTTERNWLAIIAAVTRARVPAQRDAAEEIAA